MYPMTKTDVNENIQMLRFPFKVFPITQNFNRKITLRFLNPESYRDVDITQEIIDDSHNYLPNAEVFMAFSTRQKLKKTI